jgi:hypothetical protein
MSFFLCVFALGSDLIMIEAFETTYQHRTLTRSSSSSPSSSSRFHTHYPYSFKLEFEHLHGRPIRHCPRRSKTHLPTGRVANQLWWVRSEGEEDGSADC